MSYRAKQLTGGRWVSTCVVQAVSEQARLISAGKQPGLADGNKQRSHVTRITNKSQTTTQHGSSCDPTPLVT